MGMATFNGRRKLGTVYLDIDNSVDWNALTLGSKLVYRSPDPVIDPEICKPPMLVMVRRLTRFHPFVLESCWRGELGDITEDDALEEGYDSLASFKRGWMSRTGSNHFSLSSHYWGYRFADEWNPDNLRGLLRTESNDPALDAVLNLVHFLYPHDLF